MLRNIKIKALGFQGLYLLWLNEFITCFLYQSSSIVLREAWALNFCAEPFGSKFELTVFLRLDSHVVILHDEIEGELLPAV